jgi:hypothetical protein
MKWRALEAWDSKESPKEKTDAEVAVYKFYGKTLSQNQRSKNRNRMRKFLAKDTAEFLNEYFDQKPRTNK